MLGWFCRSSGFASGPRAITNTITRPTRPCWTGSAVPLFTGFAPGPRHCTGRCSVSSSISRSALGCGRTAAANSSGVSQNYGAEWSCVLGKGKPVCCQTASLPLGHAQVRRAHAVTRRLLLRSAILATGRLDVYHSKVVVSCCCRGRTPARGRQAGPWLQLPSRHKHDSFRGHLRVTNNVR